MNDLEQAFTYYNKSESFINVDKEIISFICPDILNMQAGNKINIETSVLHLKCGSSMEVDVPETKWTGNITQEGNFKQTGNYEQKGNFKQNGNTTTTGFVLAGGGIGSSSGGLRSNPVPGEIFATGNIRTTKNIYANDGVFSTASFNTHYNNFHNG